MNFLNLMDSSHREQIVKKQIQNVGGLTSGGSSALSVLRRRHAVAQPRLSRSR
jgi:hypothetical protein